MSSRSEPDGLDFDALIAEVERLRGELGQARRNVVEALGSQP